jgi:hypothetical protein
MQNGTPVDRQWISVLMDGRLVLDWGEGLVQDILSGDFVFVEKSEYSHPIRDDELDILVRAGRVERFDTRQVSIYSLPEFPRRTIK